MSGEHSLGESFSFVVADDHPSVSFAVCQICSELTGAGGEQVTTANCSETLLDVCLMPGALPRIVILDLVMPGPLKRAALVQAVHRVDPDARIVAYSADESAFLAKAVIDAGGMGYVAKSSLTTELTEAIVAVSHGRRHIDARIDLESLKMHPWTSLTESERAVLLAFCRGEKASDIVSSSGRSYSTVTTHKYNGLTKLGLRDGSELLPYLYANGLICELDGDATPKVEGHPLRT